MIIMITKVIFENCVSLAGSSYLKIILLFSDFHRALGY